MSHPVNNMINNAENIHNVPDPNTDGPDWQPGMQMPYGWGYLIPPGQMIGGHVPPYPHDPGMAAPTQWAFWNLPGHGVAPNGHGQVPHPFLYPHYGMPFPYWVGPGQPGAGLDGGLAPPPNFTPPNGMPYLHPWVDWGIPGRVYTHPPHQEDGVPPADGLDQPVGQPGDIDGDPFAAGARLTGDNAATPNAAGWTERPATGMRDGQRGDDTSWRYRTDYTGLGRCTFRSMAEAEEDAREREDARRRAETIGEGENDPTAADQIPGTDGGQQLRPPALYTTPEGMRLVAELDGETVLPDGRILFHNGVIEDVDGGLIQPTLSYIDIVADEPCDSWEEALSRHVGFAGRWSADSGTSTRSGTTAATFVCSHGGSAKRSILKRERQETRTGVMTGILRGFTTDIGILHACFCRRRVILRNGRVTVKETEGGHSHNEDISHFSLPVAQVDPSGWVTSALVNGVKDDPIVKPRELLQRINSEVERRYPAGLIRALLQRRIGHLNSVRNGEVGRFLSDVREEHCPLNMKWLKAVHAMDVTQPPGADEYHKPFILGLHAKTDTVGNVERFAVSLSTRTLLERAHGSWNGFLVCDATHKSLTNSYKIVPIGIEDINKKFHLISINITKAESGLEYFWVLRDLRDAVLKFTGRPLQIKYVMADGAASITLAVNRVFGAQIIRLNCFFHLTQQLKRRTTGLTKKIIKFEIKRIANARDFDQFSKFVREFIQKWRIFEPNLAEYLESGYLNLDSWKSAWAYCASPAFNSRTNNSCETYNKTLQNDYFRRATMPMKRAIILLREGQPLRINSQAGVEVPSTLTLDHTTERRDLIKKGFKLSAERATTPLTEMGNRHWLRGATPGKLVVFGTDDPGMAELALRGEFSLYDNRFKTIHCTFIPLDESRFHSEPPAGAACTCEDFVIHSLCHHCYASGIWHFGWPPADEMIQFRRPVGRPRINRAGDPLRIPRGQRR